VNGQDRYDRAIGIDIGGTTIRAVLVGDDGVAVETGVRPTPSTAGADAVLAAVTDVLTEALDVMAQHGTSIAAVGVGTAGVVDDNGTITSATDTIEGWTGADVRGTVVSALDPDVPVRVLNDAHALAFGEMTSIPPDHVALIVTIGTGIGGAVVHAGKLVLGRTGTAGSLGHLSARRAAGERNGRPCSCGGVDHLEAFGSGPAIATDFAWRAGIGTVPALEDVAAAARRGNIHATAAIHDAATITGRTLAGLVNTLAPHVVILGGGVTAIGQLYLDPLVAALRADALAGPADVEVRLATGGSAAVAAGAARAAVAMINKDAVTQQ
jgi:glucokinase